MGRFLGIGKRRNQYQIQGNYWQQVITKSEKLRCVVISAGIAVLTGWLFYRSVWSLIIVIPIGTGIYHYLKKDKIEQKKSVFLLQFREMIACVAQALNIGYSAENAFKEAQSELNILYPGKSMIGEELKIIIRKLKLQIPLEQILEEFAKKVELEDVKNFAVVVMAAKRSGGNMIAIIQNASLQISEKIEVKKEIDVIIAAKKYEFQVMCVVPYIMILYMQFSFPEFVDVLYGNVVGIGVMTLCLGIYAGACIYGFRLIKIVV